MVLVHTSRDKVLEILFIFLKCLSQIIHLDKKHVALLEGGLSQVPCHTTCAVEEGKKISKVPAF